MTTQVDEVLELSLAHDLPQVDVPVTDLAPALPERPDPERRGMPAMFRVRRPGVTRLLWIAVRLAVLVNGVHYLLTPHPCVKGHP